MSFWKDLTDVAKDKEGIPAVQKEYYYKHLVTLYKDDTATLLSKPSYWFLA